MAAGATAATAAVTTGAVTATAVTAAAATAATAVTAASATDAKAAGRQPAVLLAGQRACVQSAAATNDKCGVGSAKWMPASSTDSHRQDSVSPSARFANNRVMKRNAVRRGGSAGVTASWGAIVQQSRLCVATEVTAAVPALRTPQGHVSSYLSNVTRQTSLQHSPAQTVTTTTSATTTPHNIQPMQVRITSHTP
jgi:hypothetical protein